MLHMLVIINKTFNSVNKYLQHKNAIHHPVSIWLLLATMCVMWYSICKG